MAVLRTESLRLAPAVAYRGTFAPAAAEPKSTGELPPGWEGIYFPVDAALAELRPDGSPADDGVLPVIEGLPDVGYERLIFNFIWPGGSITLSPDRVT